MTGSREILRALLVDDQRSQIEDIKRNLAPVLELVDYTLEVVGEFEDHSEATQFLVRHPNSVDLIVTDILWPKASGRRPRQDQPGLQVLRYGENRCPEAVLVALSLGDEDHISIDREAIGAGADIVRLHEKDLPGRDGSGWIELGETIARTIRGGRPYSRSPSPGVTHEPLDAGSRTPDDEVQRLESVLRRVPQICQPIIARRRDRAGISVADEYDMQDVVEVALRALYDDVRPEERTPSSAGSSSTIDFLLRNARIAIELKVATTRHADRKIKEELLVDKNDYKGHPSVHVILAVVFDFASAIRNPRGFEEDLSESGDDFSFRVLVVDAVAMLTTM